MGPTKRRGAARAAAGTLLALFAVATAPLPARAGDREPIKTSERRNATLSAAFRDVARNVAPSVVEVRTPEGDELGYAVAIGDGTRFLTSRSILDALSGPQVVLRCGDGRAAPAGIAGRNEAYDVALLRTARPFSVRPLPMGRSADLAIGAFVVSVSVDPREPLAAGVVSALDRRVEPRKEVAALDLFGLFSDGAGPRRAYASVIQHDSPLDAARYGGTPLVDSQGRLVGINVASVYRGSCFAAPIDDVARFLDDLDAGRPGPSMPKPGYLGVSIGPVERPEVRAARGLSGPGVEVRALAPGEAAERAGIRAGDVILSIDGEAVGSPERLARIVRARRPGDTVRVLLFREGKEIEISVMLGERPAE